MDRLPSRRGGRGGGRSTALFLAGLSALAGAGPVVAGSFRASPAIVEAGRTRGTVALTIANNLDRPVNLQVRLYRWTQEDGRDVYAPAPDLIASPPIFTLPGQGSQLLRVGRRSGLLSGAYRIMVQEIPTGTPARGHVEMVLRLNLPLYAYDRHAPSHLVWSAWRDANGQLFVQAANDGGHYDEIVHIALTRAGAPPLAETDRMGVVLPAGSQRWNLGHPAETGADADLVLQTRSADGRTGAYRVHMDRR